MNCAKCGFRLPGGAVRCPNCSEPVPRDTLLRRLARALGLGGAGVAPVKVTTVRTTEIRTERFQVKDARTGELRSYASLADVPPEIRTQIEQALHAAGPGLSTKVTVTDASGATKTYDSVDQIPPEIRAVYEAALKPKDGAR